MRNLAKSYYFTPGTRTITVNSVSLTDKYDIYTIINETQKIVIASSLQMDNIISVNNNVITYSNSLPVLNLGDKIKIEVEQAIQASTIVNVPGDITVTPIQGQPDYYHDLAYEISQWVDVQYPYCFAMLLSGMSKMQLTGAAKYKTSDGVIHTTDGVVNIGVNESGRENKTTQFVIFRFSSPLPVYTFSSYSITTPITNTLIGFYNYNCLISNLNFYNVKLDFFINDASAETPIIFNGTRYKQDLVIASQFSNTNIKQFIYPSLRSDATDSEKVVNVSGNCFQGSPIDSFIIPTGYKNINFSGANNFYGCTAIKSFNLPNTIETLIMGTLVFQAANICSFNFNSNIKTINFGNQNFYGITLDRLIIPDGVENIDFSGYQTFTNTPRLKYIKLPVPTKTFKGFSSQTFGTQTELILELGNNWPYTIDVGSATTTYTPPYIAADMETYILNKLIELKTVGGRIPYIKINTGTLTVWNAVDNTGTTLDSLGDSAKFTQIFRVGQVVIINRGTGNENYTITSIQNDNQMTMSVNSVAGTYQLNHNKIVTFGATLLTRLSVEQKAIATNKLWQLL